MEKTKLIKPLLRYLYNLYFKILRKTKEKFKIRHQSRTQNKNANIFIHAENKDSLKKILNGWIVHKLSTGYPMKINKNKIIVKYKTDVRTVSNTEKSNTEKIQEINEYCY